MKPKRWPPRLNLMADVAIRPFLPQYLTQLPQVITGYTTSEIYAIAKDEWDTVVTFSLKLVSLPTPKTITYNHLDEAELARLGQIVAVGMSLGAFFEAQLVGVALASAEVWNSSLRVWELHVTEEWRGQGIGRRLMEGVVDTAVAHRLRVIVCETQSSNVPAIRAYRKLGFVLDGIDLSYYSNEDVQKEDVAIFMKRHLPG
ncbi:GNAT family N-acetyltransferase [Candidatus Leptofilum sp.]|uniref:GNAT family N-acetyltransferase n=1 Tax=Candidatus Leptofilum sp. TaxID=3241576 RepID=UPI003B5CD03D